MKGFWMKYRGQLLATVVLLLLVAAAPMQTYYEREFTAPDLEIPTEAEKSVQLTEDEDPVLKAEPGFQGTVAAAECVTLQQGTYRIQVVAWSEGDGNRLEIYSPRHLNEDNTEGQLVAESDLGKNGELLETTFQVTESLEDISFRVWYDGEGDFNITSLYLTSTGRMYQDPFILMGLIVLASLLILLGRMKWGEPDRAEKRALLVLGVAVLAASLPLCFPYVLDGNDLYYQFNRIQGIQEALKSGQFPVKLHSTFLHGYGYGSSIFYPELFLYIPAIFGCLGMSLIGCYRLLLLLVHGATAFVSYRSFSGVFRSKEKGVLAAFLYTLSIYRLIDLYTRAALGEGMAMIFLPLVMWGMYELFLGNEKKWYLAALGFTGVMQCHILSTELAVCFGGLFGLLYIGRLREKGRFRALLAAAGSTVLLNLGLMLPILQHSAYPFHVFSVESTLSWWTTTLPKLFDVLMMNPTERMYAGLENSGEMPCTVGLVLLLGVAAFLYVWVQEEKRKQDKTLRTCMTALALALLGIYASTSYFPWDKVQSIGLVSRAVTTLQLPWRCLAVSTALLCPVTAEAVWRLGERREIQKLLYLGVGSLGLACSLIYVNRYNEEAFPRYTCLNQYQREQAQVDVMYFIDVEHSNSFRMWNRENIFVASEGVTLSDCTRTEKPTAGFTYEKAGDGESFVDVSLTWYPDYQAELADGTALQTGVGDGGVLRVYLPEQTSGMVRVVYREPWYIQGGRLVFLTALAGLCIFIFRRKKNTKNA